MSVRPGGAKRFGAGGSLSGCLSGGGGQFSGFTGAVPSHKYAFGKRSCASASSMTHPRSRASSKRARQCLLMDSVAAFPSSHSACDARVMPTFILRTSSTNPARHTQQMLPFYYVADATAWAGQMCIRSCLPCCAHGRTAMSVAAQSASIPRRTTVKKSLIG